MSYVIGIDPGVSGAIVILQSEACPFPVEWLRMPTIKQGKSSRVDAAAVARFLQEFDCGHAYIEQVGSMPGQGVASTFTFGHAAGVVEGIVIGQMIPVTKVAPVTWKRRAGLVGTDKDAARSRAIQLWPRWAALGKKGEGQALADAALIARFGPQTQCEGVR